MTVLVPIDRIHFLDEQRRNRRTGRVTAVLVALLPVLASFLGGGSPKWAEGIVAGVRPRSIGPEGG